MFQRMTDSREWVANDKFTITTLENDSLVIETNTGIRIYVTANNKAGTLTVRGGSLETATLTKDGDISFSQNP